MESAASVAPLLQVASVNWLHLCFFVALSVLLYALIASQMKKPKIPKGKTLPPGPPALPLIGHLPLLRKIFDHNACMEYSKKYGAVIRFQVGGKNIIVLNDFESIKEVLTRKEVLYRTENFILRRFGVNGIVTLNGDAWQENRRFCLHVLRDLGFGRKSMEEHVKEEARYLTEKILDLRGAPLEVRKYLVPSMSNNITALVFGSRYPFEDYRRKFLDETLAKALKIVASGPLFTFLPRWTFSVAELLPFTSISTIRSTLGDIFRFITEQVKQHEDTIDENSNRDFIDGYINKMKEHKDNPDSFFKMGNLLGNVLNFFGAGSNTVILTINWHLLNCAGKVDSVQRVIQEEIDSVIGRERQPCWEDHKKMPFTVATIWEMYRWRTVAPLGVPREAAADTEYKGNFIPKGSVILANIAAVHMNPDIWNDPDEFNPRRFLKEDGSSLITKPEQLIPFSIGRRMCPGETLATVEVFLYLTTLLQKFSILPMEGENIDLDAASLTLNVPKPQRLRFICRFCRFKMPAVASEKITPQHKEDPGEATRLAFTIVVPWLLLVASIAWLRKSKAPRGTTLPPGPPGYPVVGLLPLGAKLLHPKFLKEWTEKYGPVLRLKVAFTNLIVLNDFESIKEVMCMKELLHRTGNLVIDQTGCKGLLSQNGQIWNDNRRICLHVLRDLGFGKKAMEDWMKEEAEYLVKKIAEHRGAPSVVLELLVPSASNNISAIIFGARYPFEDSRRKFLDDRLKRLSKFIGNRSLNPLLPVLVTRLASKIPILRERLPGPILDDLLAFIKREIKEHEETLDENSDRDFIDAYLKKIKENKDNPSSTFTIDTLIGNIFSLFIAGYATVKETLQWHMMVCAYKPDSVQRRIQEEIDHVVGRERAPSWADRNAMPFTMAFLWEMYRWRTVTPLGIPRMVGKDVVYKNLFLPKGTTVMANLRAVHMSPQYWKDPEEFNPSRFLNEDGSALLPKPDQLIPFGVGKRMCPGETMATVEIFLYLTTILQAFNVLPEEGQSIDLSSETTALRLAQNPKLCFISRQIDQGP
ncbi:uncharacterized protein LOC144129934 [Amblyomma americanum]